MKQLYPILLFLTAFVCFGKPIKIKDSFLQIKNFHFISPQLASSGLIDLDKYQAIKDYGFQHVINLIPGNQDLERAKVQSLGLSYVQISVDWSEPTLDNFERFLTLMKQYKGDKIYVHCEANYRASTFVYLYQLVAVGIDEEKAKKDLDIIWKPTETWQGFIEKIKFTYQD